MGRALSGVDTPFFLYSGRAVCLCVFSFIHHLYDTSPSHRGKHPTLPGGIDICIRTDNPPHPKLVSVDIFG